MRALSAVAVALLTAAATVQAAPVTISDFFNPGASAVIEYDGPGGVMDVTVAGQDQLAKQWFWVRTGGAGAFTRIDQLAGVSVISGGTALDDYVTLRYTDGATFEMDLTLTIFGISATQSDLQEEITIRNLTASPLTVDLVKFADWNLLGDADDETVMISSGVGDNRVTQTEAGNALAVSEAVAGPAAAPSRVQAGDPSIATGLDNGTITDLAAVGSDGPTAIGDAAWAWQWTLSLDGGEGKTFGFDNYVEVPEPASVMLVGMGGLMMLRQRRPRPRK